MNYLSHEVRSHEVKWTQTGMRFPFGWKSHFSVQWALYFCSHELSRNETQNSMDFISVILTKWNFKPADILEYSDFFSQWTGGKMKIWLEKSAVNISKLTGGKNEKARQRALHFSYVYTLLTRNIEWKSNQLNMWYVKKRLSI